ncbi:hypothetical protein POTOM_004384 [Populus tomentosa]|uniref:RING-type E3 ubiquitin transferase n=1 Tax=Populus tomentosa TaxID=118781 RepID=A0A8X8AVD4_POPTO|nr:hypothetical protein POTOM_004384 [Populus tomentosa]
MSSEIPFISSHENNNGWDQDNSRLIPFDESARILLEFEVSTSVLDDLSEYDYSDFEDESTDGQEDMGFEDNMSSVSSESYTSHVLDANDLSMQLRTELALGEVSPLPPPYTFTLYSAGFYLEDPSLRLAETLSDNEGPKAQSASKESIENLEEVKIDRGSSNLECPVCLETISTGSEAKRMPCFHIYHGKCIVEWLMNSNTCPVCRYQMPTES